MVLEVPCATAMQPELASVVNCFADDRKRPVQARSAPKGSGAACALRVSADLARGPGPLEARAMSSSGGIAAPLQHPYAVDIGRCTRYARTIERWPPKVPVPGWVRRVRRDGSVLEQRRGESRGGPGGRGPAGLAIPRNHLAACDQQRVHGSGAPSAPVCYVSIRNVSSRLPRIGNPTLRVANRMSLADPEVARQVRHQPERCVRNTEAWTPKSPPPSHDRLP